MIHQFAYEWDNQPILSGYTKNNEGVVSISWRINFSNPDIPEIDWYNLRSHHTKHLPDGFITSLTDYYRKEKMRIMLGKYKDN